jgi:hypothetical protein
MKMEEAVSETLSIRNHYSTHTTIECVYYKAFTATLQFLSLQLRDAKASQH